MFVSELEFELHKRQLNRILEIERLKLKILEKEIKINEKMNELWSEETLIRDGAKINQELLEIQKTLGELEKTEGGLKNGRNRKIL